MNRHFLARRCRVSVTPADIAAGVRRDPRSCAVAIAIRRELGVEAVVTGAAVELDGQQPCSSSLALADWLWDFDGDRTVDPIVVELRLEEKLALIVGQPREHRAASPAAG